MTTKVKSKILYIESDDSNEQNQTTPKTNKQQQQIQQQQKEIQNIKKRINERAGNRFNNNIISKGYFVDQKHQQYKYQHHQQPNNSTNTIQNNLRSSRHNRRMKTQTISNNQFKQKQQIVTKQQIKKNEQLVKQNQNKIKIMERSKKLMFQFDSQSQQQQTKQQTKKDKKQQKQKPKLMQSDKKSRQISQSQKNQQNHSIFQQSSSKCQENSENKQQQQQNETNNTKQKQQKKENKNQIIYITPNYMYSKIDVKQFMIGQLPINCRLQCKIVKKNEILNMLLPQFDLFFRNYLVHIASCKKFIGSIGANYRISTKMDDFSYVNNQVIGKVRSITSNDLYNIYDDGIKLDDVPGHNPQYSQVNRQVLATVRIRSGKGPRNITVYVLKHGINFYSLLGTSLKKQTNLQMLYNIEQNRKNIYLFKSRKPEWVQKKKQYYLNFDGRINQASIRNLILEDPQSGLQVLMFGKNANNIYNIDISYPLTPKIGFGIVVPQLDRND